MTTALENYEQMQKYCLNSDIKKIMLLILSSRILSKKNESILKFIFEQCKKRNSHIYH